MPVVETDVQSGFGAMRQIVTGWTSQLYQTIFSHLYLVVIILFLVVVIFVISKSIQSFRSSKIKKMKICSTNKWFDWDTYKQYLKDQSNK